MTQATRTHRITRWACNRDRAIVGIVALLCASGVWTACRDCARWAGPRPPATRGVPAERPVSPSAAPAGLGSSAAFELVATSDGAALFWAPPAACSRGLALQRFDAEGRAQGTASSIAAVCAGAQAGAIHELSAAAGGGQLGVAWIVEAAGQARVFATHGDDAGSVFAAPTQLGAADAQARAERARLWLVASESGQQRLAWHAPRVACAGEAGGCAQLVSEANPPARDAAGRRGDVREIPQPCSRLLVGSVWTQGIWYDAFCALDATGQQSTTQVYAIRPEIFYAEASPVLVDCEPLGLSPSRLGAVAWGRCSDGLRAHGLAPDGSRKLIHTAVRTASCEDGRPAFSVRGARGQLDTWVLDAPRDRLELWLPPELAKSGSRAVFTGRRLVIAWAEADRLLIRSLRCQGHALVSEPPAIL